MYLVRLWLFTERDGPYSEGGTYDTSVVDMDTGNCSDSQQFDRFEALLDYANARGEELQEVESADEAYTICSRQRYTVGALNCGGGLTNATGTMSAAISRPISICGAPYVGGGSRPNAAPPPCPPVTPIVEPVLNNQPVVTTVMDNARRLIALARKNKIVPTIVY